MMPRAHITFGFIFALILYFLTGQNIIIFAIVFVSSLIPDLDHYFVYLFKYKYISPIKIYRNAIKKKLRYRKLTRREKLYWLVKGKGVIFFHSIEIILIIFLILLILCVSYSWPLLYAFAFLAGFLLHFLLDVFDGTLVKEKYSIILYIIARRKLLNTKSFNTSFNTTK